MKPSIRNKVLRSSALLITALLAVFLAGCGGGGGSGGAATPSPTTPVITLSSPAPGGSVSDVDFHSSAFAIKLNYSDTSPMNISSLVVTLKMDNGQEQNITNYFSQSNATTIQSSDLYQFTRTLFVLPSNTVARTMTVSASIRSQAGVSGSSSALFTVYPVTPAPPPPPRLTSAIPNRR